MSSNVSEQEIVAALHRVPTDRWPTVLHVLQSMQQVATLPAIRTASDLAASGAIGIWSERDDLGERHTFARSLRARAQSRDRDR